MAELSSVVIPVYGNEASLPELLAELEGLAKGLPGPLEVVFVIDGSPDASLEVLRARLPQASFASQLVAHARNFGSFAAIRTGLGVARGEVIGVMAADLQEPAALMAEFFTALRAGHDVVYGERSERNDPAMTALTSKLFWGFYRRFIMRELPEGGVDIFGVSRAARDALLSLSERNSSLVAQLFWIGFKRAPVKYARRPRPYGRSAWTLSKKLKYLTDSIYGFSDLPIRMLTLVGTVAMAVGFVGGSVVLAGRLLGAIPVAGYTPVVLSIIFFGGLNSFGLGIIGQYVWRAFENTKARPLSLVHGHERFDGARSSAQGLIAER